VVRAAVDSPAATSGEAQVPAVLVDGLVKSYAGRRVVDSVSWQAAAGAVTAVLGPNGAGKTTTLECCEGLRRPDAGTVRVAGLDPVADAGRVRSLIGVMIQDGGLPSGATVGRLLAHVAGLHARPVPPQQLLDVLGLSAVAGTRVRRLSGGQRQRLALALAVVGRPAVVFLDEPTAGLDPQARQVVHQVVERLRDDGVAVLVTTHLIDDVEQLADHVLVMDAGKVVARGSPAQLTGDDDVLSFTAADLDLAALAAVLGDGVAISATRSPRGASVDHEVRSRDGGPLDPAVTAQLTAWLAAQGRTPERLRLGRPSLEDVFLDLTGRTLR
jgi:ABC-2 type transport system ATP-binding protein